MVVDNGCPVVTSGVLSSLPERYDDVTLVRSPVNRGFALGNNLGLGAANGATVVFLNNDTEVQPGWLDPLVGALEDPEVLGVQSLLVYPSGSVQSAGVVFPRGGGIPHVLLQGFPTEDAEGLEHESLHALTGAALAVRHSDVGGRCAGSTPCSATGWRTSTSASASPRRAPGGSSYDRTRG